MAKNGDETAAVDLVYWAELIETYEISLQIEIKLKENAEGDEEERQRRARQNIKSLERQYDPL
jgi:hypothetical protein